MLLKKLVIENFGCFPGIHEITFSPTLTLIIGDNGDGKTTIFEALSALLQHQGNEQKNLFISRFSKKAERELQDGDSKEMSLELFFEHKGQEFQLKKSCVFSRQNGVLSVPDTILHTALVERDSGERVDWDASKLIERIFDTSLRQFCLFKGESELDAISKAGAFGELLKTLSDIASFDDFKKYVDELSTTAGKGLKGEERKCKKNSAEIGKIHANRDEAKKKLKYLDEEITSTQIKHEAYESLYNRLKANQDVFQALDELNKQREETVEKLDRLQVSTTSINPNISLLDDLWILKGFSPVFEEFRKKADYWNSEKRAARVEAKAKEEAKEEAMKEAKESVLSILTPDESALENLIKAERCEVCGRDAKKGTEAYQHMCDRLKELKKALEGREKEPSISKQLFCSKHTEEINAIYNSLTGETQRELNVNMDRVDKRMKKLIAERKELEQETVTLADIEGEIKNLFIRNSLNESVQSILKMQETLFDAYGQANRLEGILEQLNKRKEKVIAEIEGYDKELSSLTKDDPNVEFLRRVYEILSDIQRAFVEGREANADQLIARLEKKSNEYLSKLSAHDFYGFIKLIRNKTPNNEDEVIVELQDNLGGIITNPNGAQKTSECLAILFAIAELRQKKNDDLYPLIFDAPTSSFSSGRESNFYEIVTNFNKQCLILTKDLLTVDGSPDLERIKKLTCSVLRIQKKPDFIPGDLATIESEIKVIRA